MFLGCYNLVKKACVRLEFVRHSFVTELSVSQHINGFITMRNVSFKC